MEFGKLAIRSGCLAAVLSNGSCFRQVMRRGVANIPTHIPADPTLHSGELPQGEVDAAFAKTSETQRPSKPTDDTDTNPLVPPKPPVTSSPKLETTLNKPINPSTQQRRHDTSTVEKEEAVRERRRERKEQAEDDKEYFKHHKASPLSEIEVADTRKPISRATDRTADSYTEDVVLFSDEQRDSADDTLRRAAEMWGEARERGDPDSPHGRVLRELRGENW